MVDAAHVRVAHRRRRAAAVVLLCLAQGVLLVHTAWDKSDTADEVRYVASGAAIWAGGSFRDLCEAPALPKLGFALAVRAVAPEIARVPPRWQEAMPRVLDAPSAGGIRWIFFAARWATIAITVIAGLALWRAATRFGAGAGLAALALWAFSPTVLANGSLAALDAWAAAFVALFTLAAVRLYERPSWMRAVALGIVVGALAATKVTALLVVPVAVLLVVIFGLGEGDRRCGWRGAGARLAVAAAAAFFTLWAIYGFTLGGIDRGDPCAFLAAPGPPGRWPFPAWIEGVLYQLRHAATGHANYLLGESNTEGWWTFYLVALAVKTTLGVQALVLLRLATMATLRARRAWVGWRIDLALLAFPAALLLLMSAGRHQANVSFLLPAFPLGILWVARGLPLSGRAFGGLGRGIFVALLAAAAVESVAVHPHHLMFFNAWAGGPDGGYRYLIHREDWGQDKRRLARWQRENGIARLYYTPYGPNADRWGVVYDPVPCEPREGVYALHAVEVHRPHAGLLAGCVDWLTIEPPDERIGHSIYIYRVDGARLRRLARERASGVEPFWRSGRPPASATPSSAKITSGRSTPLTGVGGSSRR